MLAVPACSHAPAHAREIGPERGLLMGPRMRALPLLFLVACTDAGGPTGLVIDADLQATTAEGEYTISLYRSVESGGISWGSNWQTRVFAVTAPK